MILSTGNPWRAALLRLRKIPFLVPSLVFPSAQRLTPPRSLSRVLLLQLSSYRISTFSSSHFSSTSPFRCLLSSAPLKNTSPLPPPRPLQFRLEYPLIPLTYFTEDPPPAAPGLFQNRYRPDKFEIRRHGRALSPLPYTALTPSR